MGVNGIVSAPRDRNNEPSPRDGSDGRARLILPAFATGPRPLTLLLIAVPVALWRNGRGNPLEFLTLVAIFAIMSEAEMRLMPRISAPRQAIARLAFRFLYALLVVAASVYTPHWHWLSPVLLSALVMEAAHARHAMPPRELVAVTALAAVANIASETLRHTMLPGLGGEAHTSGYGPFEATLLAVTVFPAMAIFGRYRADRAYSSRRAMEESLIRLRSTRDDLRRSQQHLQRWNRELRTDVDRLSDELTERNRYLSIINAVSFALAEPMDDARTLERAVRLVARLLGVRAAQAYTRPRGVEVIDFFVAVAPEDIHAPRLPEALLRRVAKTGRPLSSAEASAQTEEEGGDPLPDLGEPYRVVPLVAKGRVLGSFALIGEGTLPDDDDGRHLLLLVGREMGVALENARLYREAIEKAEREEFLTEVTRLLNASGRGERQLPAVLDAFIAHTAASEALLVSIPDGSRDVVIAGVAIGEGVSPRLEPLARSLARLVEDRGRPLVLGLSGEAPLSDRLASEGLTTVAVAPVLTTRGSITGDQARPPHGRDPRGSAALHATPSLSGALIVATGADAEWDEAQTELLERVTNVIARRVQADEFVAIQQQRIRELTGLAEVARTMQSGADVERLYNGFAAALQRLLPYEALYIARVSEAGLLEAIPTFGGRGRPAEPPEFRGAEADHPWFGLRGPLLWRYGDPGGPPRFLPAGARSVVVVPMRPKGQMLGLAILVVSRPIRDDQMHIVEQAVEQLSLALDGAALYQQATERASHIQALSNLARIVASVVNLREAFSAFSEEVRWLIPFDRAVMFLLDESERWVEPYATYPDVTEDHGLAPLPYSIASAPIDEGQAVTFRRDDARYAHLDWSLLGPDAREVAAVPVRQGERTSAVFALVTDATGLYGANELDALEEVAGLLAVTIERLRLYEHADHSAKHDLLTELPNYRYLQERLGVLPEGAPAALIVVDMDNLKIFNDTLGHEVGDRVIQIVGDVLSRSCRHEDFVARTGGDEFVILMDGAQADAAVVVGDRIHDALRDAHREIADAPARIGVSIGIATTPDDARTAADLLHAADQAMYDAKFAGGQRTRLASDRAAAVAPRTLRGRGTRLADTVVRALASGATPDEMSALSLAQHWADIVVSHAGMSTEDLSELRLALAAEASKRFRAPRRDRDQTLALRLVGQMREDRSGAGHAVTGRQLTVAAEVLLEVAWGQMPPPVGKGMSEADALRAVGEARPEVVADPVWRAIEHAVRVGGGRRKRDAA